MARKRDGHGFVDMTQRGMGGFIKQVLVCYYSPSPIRKHYLLTFPPSIRSMLFTAKSLLPKWIIHHKPQGESRATCSYLHGQLGPTRACTMRGGETW